MIAKIVVKGLFGYQDYTLNLKKLDGMNFLMITAPIGYGKSVLLKMIRGALNYKKNPIECQIFKEIQFSSFKVIDELCNNVTITKSNNIVTFMCDQLKLSAGYLNYTDYIDRKYKVDGTPQEKYVKWHFSDGNNNLHEDYYKRMLEHPSRGASHLFELYDFLFNAEDDVLLIDSPEDNLHMVNIERITKDIQYILKNSNKQIIVATHSPAFINGRWNNNIDLFDLSKK